MKIRIMKKGMNMLKSRGRRLGMVLRPEVEEAPTSLDARLALLREFDAKEEAGDYAGLFTTTTDTNTGGEFIYEAAVTDCQMANMLLIDWAVAGRWGRGEIMEGGGGISAAGGGIGEVPLAGLSMNGGGGIGEVPLAGLSVAHSLQLRAVAQMAVSRPARHCFVDWLLATGRKSGSEGQLPDDLVADFHEFAGRVMGGRKSSRSGSPAEGKGRGVLIVAIVFLGIFVFELFVEQFREQLFIRKQQRQ
eukprot:g5011.t1